MWYPKSALYLSLPTDRSKTERDEETDRLPDPKREGLIALSQGYWLPEGHPSSRA